MNEYQIGLKRFRAINGHRGLGDVVVLTDPTISVGMIGRALMGG